MKSVARGRAFKSLRKSQRTRSASYLLLILWLFVYCVGRDSPKPYNVSSRSYKRFRCATKQDVENGLDFFMDVIPSEPFGRLGNVQLALMFATLEAWERGCHLRLPLEIEALPGWRSKCPLIINERAGGVFNYLLRSGHCGPRQFKDFGSVLRNRRLLDKHSTAFALDVIALYSGTNETHAYGIRCNDASKTAVHVRGGDLVSGGFDASGRYHNYVNGNKFSGVSSRAPFVSAYYLKALETILEENPKTSVEMFFEDRTSPTYLVLEPFHVVDNIAVHVGRDLLQDVVDMSCSANLISSRGSFIYSIIMRYRHQRVHFLSDGKASPYRCHLPSGSGYYLVNDTQYHDLVSQSSWHNGMLQRDLLNRYYEVLPSKCTRCSQNLQCVL